MSKHKSNVHPGHYKVAGRERQGEDVVHDQHKAWLAQSQAVIGKPTPYPDQTASTETPEPQKETVARAGRDQADSVSVGRKRPAARARVGVKASKGKSSRAGSRTAPARQASSSARRRSARRRSAALRSASARKAARTRGRKR
jgi:hypothetical protein